MSRIWKVRMAPECKRCCKKYSRRSTVKHAMHCMSRRASNFSNLFSQSWMASWLRSMTGGTRSKCLRSSIGRSSVTNGNRSLTLSNLSRFCASTPPRPRRSLRRVTKGVRSRIRSNFASNYKMSWKRISSCSKTYTTQKRPSGTWSSKSTAWATWAINSYSPGQ